MNFRWNQVVQKIDPGFTLIRNSSLAGGTSARVEALEVLHTHGHSKKMVVRQYGDEDTRQNPKVASCEFTLLQLLQSQGFPAPKPYYLDDSREILSIPYIVTEFVEGKNGTAHRHASVLDMMSQLADCLVDIHSVGCSDMDLSFLRKQAAVNQRLLTEKPERLDETSDEGRIRDILIASYGGLRKNKNVLLHGDFWTGNTMWRENRLTSVIDWEDAAVGDPLSDLANARLEVLWAFGIEAMNHFTERYELKMANVDFTDLPYWDLYAALRLIGKIPEWGLDASTEKQMRDRHRWFLSEAFQRLTLLG